MKIVIFGKDEKDFETQTLISNVINSIDELGLTDFIELEKRFILEGKDEDFGVTSFPALCIEENSIDFKDIIFEGQNPDSEDIKSMFISIIGGGDSAGGCGSCSTEGGCGTCSVS